jgi:phage gp29-like protein
MSLEKELGRIADALEKIVSGGVVLPKTQTTTQTQRPAAQQQDAKPAKTRKKTTSSTPATPPPAAPPTTDAPVTKDDVMDELRQLVTNKGAEQAKAVLQEFGADRISAVPENQFPQLLERMKEVNGS